MYLLLQIPFAAYARPHKNQAPVSNLFVFDASDVSFNI